MSKRSSKLMEISKMFDEINIDFDKLSNDGINDILTIVKKNKMILDINQMLSIK